MKVGSHATLQGRTPFGDQDHQGKRQDQTMAGGDFLWLLLRHVLPRRFRRDRDIGLLDANAKRLIQLLHLTLQMRLPPPDPLPPRPPVHCERCGEVITILARVVQLRDHRLC